MADLQMAMYQLTTADLARINRPGEGRHALRDLTRLVAVCAGHGPNIGTTPSGCSTTRCRGPGCAPSTGCSGWSAATSPARSRRRAAGLDVNAVNASKIAAMLAHATEHDQPALPGVAGSPAHPW